MTEARLIKIDRNGSKHYEGYATCDRCGGSGYYAIGVVNGKPLLSPLDGGICYKCHGTGKVFKKWIERTPEYQANLDARRQAKREAEQAKREKELKEAEAKRQAREAELEALRKVSKHIGTVGDKVTTEATYVKMFSYDIPSFKGFGTDTIHVHMFKDSEGNVLVWKTTSFVEVEEGKAVILSGKVKEHSEYRGERQTVLTRCKVTEA